MQLTLYTDYSLRVLLYLATHPNQLVDVGTIATAFGISRHHLLKVVRGLAQHGWVETVRGRNGGLRLAQKPATIRVGHVIRQTEPTLNPVECFDRATNTCPIAPACVLKQALAEARVAYFRVLDGYTLATIARRKPLLETLWKQ